MTYFIEHSVWLAALLILVPATVLAMAGPIVVRRFVKLDRLRANNEVAGFKFATVGVIYAVLLAFVVIVVWEKFNSADSGVAREAGASVTIYRLTGGLDDQHGAAIRKALTAYLDAVIKQDWPAMEHGKVSGASDSAMNELYRAVLRYHADSGESVVLAELLRQVDILSQSRRDRVVAANSGVPTVLWVVLIGGAILTVCFTFFFGTDNLRAQAMMTGALALLTFAGLLAIVAIDQPFGGSVRVKPDALIAIQHDYAGK
jgi:hypothetical protein